MRNQMASNSSLFSSYRAFGPKQPCSKDCPDRKAGCAINCEKWSTYLKEREVFYEKRLIESETNVRNDSKRNAINHSIRRKKSEPGWH